MHTRSGFKMAGAAAILSVGLVGCGLFGGHPAAASHSSARHHDRVRSRRHDQGASPSTAASSSPLTPVTTSASSTAGGSAPDSGPASPPPPPNAGAYSELIITKVSASNDGTGSASGHTENVLLVNLTIQNPSTGNVELALNDFAVVPVGGPYAYSWNDYDTSGLSQGNSLFWPVDAQNPNTNPVTILSGSSASGAVTVQVPSASRYEIVWGSPSSDQVAATFSPP